MSQITHLPRFCTLDFVFFLKFTNIDTCNILDCRSVAEYSTILKIFWLKSMCSQLSNALSNAFIAFLVPEISSLQVKKLAQ